MQRLPNFVKNGHIHWTYTMIKAKQSFIGFHWKIEFDSKMDRLVGHDLSILMTLSVGRIDMWVNPKLIFMLSTQFLQT